jgi:hypothetical protein
MSTFATGTPQQAPEPHSARQAWHAQLSAEDGAQLDFHNPIELLRHLSQLGSTAPPPGRLR